MGLYLNDQWRLKAFSGQSKSGTSSIRIEIETDNCYEFGFFLEGLAEIERRQTAKAGRRKQRQPLMLPAPDEVGR
ncbi:MAG: hypothetical protein KDJ98_08160 [Rhodobacteraceae bacterium]|nr:hypothetical protein [Paracoccaceae bacterium]